MKKIAELTLRGQIAVNTNSHRLQVFDGKYTTGYKVVEFRISSSIPYSAEDIVAKLQTAESTTSIGQWDWSDNQEFAWATWGSPSGTTEAQSFVDLGNMIVEDLYLTNYSQTGDTGEFCNYYIRLEKYEFPAWTGAGFMVENLSQAGPQ
jgi:hypothetical protein